MLHSKKFTRIIPVFLIASFATSCINNARYSEDYLEQLLQRYVGRIEKDYTQKNIAYWDALISQNDSALKKFESLEISLMERIIDRQQPHQKLDYFSSFSNYLFESQEDIEYLKSIQSGTAIDDVSLQRNAKLLYLNFLYAQEIADTPPQISRLKQQIDTFIKNYRISYYGKSVPPEKLVDKFYQTINQDTLRYIWEQITAMSDSIEPQYREILTIRNDLAKQMGFSDYYSMKLFLNEQDTADITLMLHQLDLATRTPYIQFKNRVDSLIINYYKINPNDIMPWHYRSFSMPRLITFDGKTNCVNIDKEKDLINEAQNYFANIGLPIDDILKNSYIVLNDSVKSMQYSFTMDIDNQNDVRLAVRHHKDFSGLINLWHNIGHAVYEQNIPTGLPFLFREPNMGMHETVASIFQFIAEDTAYLNDSKFLNIQTKDCTFADDYFSLKKIFLARYLLVAVAFEKQMYANPQQDLNKLWWDLMEKYQMLNRPPKAYQTRWTLAGYVFRYDCYLQHYIIGILGAYHFKHHFIERYKKSNTSNIPWYRSKSFGEYMKTIFEYGNSVHWKDVFVAVTNEPLNYLYLKNALEASK